ncbi:MAG: universal stress protein [Methanomassiliicoccus sp.]|nr:universal stress protein [Methanomassiliicoccus sp.]
MNIIVGTDGKPHSEKAVEFSFAYAKAFRGTLYIMYIVSPKAQEDKDKNIKNGMRVLGRAKIRASEVGVDIATLLEAGEPQDTILLAAEKLDADCIILGSSGEKSGLAKIMGTSVSETIFKNANCTVVVVR